MSPENSPYYREGNEKEREGIDQASGDSYAGQTGAQQLSLTEAISQFKYASEVEGKAKATINQYNYVFENFLNFLGTDLPVKKIEPNTVRGFIRGLMNQNYSKSTVAINHRVLQTFFNWLVEEDLLEAAPTENIREPRTPNKFPRVLTLEQAEQLIKASEQRKNTWAGFRNHTIILCFLDMGLRLNELASAKLTHLNLKERTLKVHGKGSKDRMVFFGFETYKTLRKWMNMRNEKGEPMEETIFISQNGDRLKHRYIQRIVTRIQDRAGLNDTKVSPHVLRHTAATLAVKNGMEAFALKRYFGWEKLDTAMRYVHMNNETVKDSFRDASPIDNLERSK
ncbi:tyrosine-type recombinase/integrase [Candidatus Bipolaricaulota bacterium]|nr:tyrosine-type recombinase/integrase [Candidatus Bipolaricaulota bacterium]